MSYGIVLNNENKEKIEHLVLLITYSNTEQVPV